MLNYLNGEIVSIKKETIVLENNGFGFEIFVPNPKKFLLNENVHLFIFDKINEETISYYGFKNEEEKITFSRLLLVQGIGPKTALLILKKCDYSILIRLIKSSSQKELEKISGIGNKANIIINTLKNKFNDFNYSLFNYQNVFFALKKIGYDETKIFNVLNDIEPNLNESIALKRAIELIKNYEC